VPGPWRETVFVSYDLYSIVTPLPFRETRAGHYGQRRGSATIGAILSAKVLPMGTG